MKKGINMVKEAMPMGRLIEETMIMEIMAVITFGKKCIPTLVIILVMLLVPRVSLFMVLPD